MRGKQERKNKISKGLRNTIDKMNPEERKKKFSRFGEKNSNYGNKWNEEQRKSLSCKLKGKISPKLGLTFEEYFGKEIADKLKENLSDHAKKRTGNKNPFFGKSHSIETRKNISENRKGKKPSNMKKINIDGIEYESLTDASKQTGIKGTTIWHRIKSKNKKYKNYNYVD